MSTGSGFARRLRQLDAYPKVNEDFFTRTLSGGVITIAASLCMLVLFLSETIEYTTVRVVNELSVDRSRGEQMQINVDLTLHHLGCSYISIDVMDVSGETHLHVDEHEILKQRIDLAGRPVEEPPEREEVGPEVLGGEDANGMHSSISEMCLSCYGAEAFPGQCCNTCEQVRDAYRKKGWAISPTSDVEQCKTDQYAKDLETQRNEGCHVVSAPSASKRTFGIPRRPCADAPHARPGLRCGVRARLTAQTTLPPAPYRSSRPFPSIRSLLRRHAARATAGEQGGREFPHRPGPFLPAGTRSHARPDSVRRQP